MSVHLIIPVRGLNCGKSRLAPVLTAAARADLVAGMLAHVVAAGTAAARFETVVVISGDGEALALARAQGARTLSDPPEGGLNAALGHAAATIPLRDAIMVVPADLPRVTPEDLRELASAGADGVALAADKAGAGTNGLFLAPAARALPFRFGEASFAAHGAAARALGFEPIILRRPGLAFDLDSPDDYADWISAPRSPRNPPSR